jgi:hypothetical protein
LLRQCPCTRFHSATAVRHKYQHNHLSSSLQSAKQKFLVSRTRSLPLPGSAKFPGTRASFKPPKCIPKRRHMRYSKRLMFRWPKNQSSITRNGNIFLSAPQGTGGFQDPPSLEFSGDLRLFLRWAKRRRREADKSSRYNTEVNAAVAIPLFVPQFLRRCCLIN